MRKTEQFQLEECHLLYKKLKRMRKEQNFYQILHTNVLDFPNASLKVKYFLRDWQTLEPR
jgi:hypothetical protein